MQAIKALINGSPALAVFAVFWVGCLASLSSCTLIRIPVVFGYVGGTARTNKRSLAVLISLILGLIFSYSVLGLSLIVLKDIVLGLIMTSRYIYIIFGLILLGFGLYFSGLIPIWTPQDNCDAHQEKISKRTLGGAFLFGMLFAFLEMPACPCCASVLLVLASIISVSNSWIYSMILFLSFAIGQSFPIFLIGCSTGIMGSFASKISKAEKYVQYAAGNVLLVIGLIFLILA